MFAFGWLAVTSLSFAAPAKIPAGAERIEVGTLPAVSPDGKRFAFVWAGDIWVAPIEGGAASRLTTHPAEETSPAWSPNGKEIAFVSDRTGSTQVFVVAAEGGVPEQLTVHTEGHFLMEWYPDGKRLLVRGRRDFAGRSSYRFYEIARNGKAGERLLFDAEGDVGRLSKDGKSLLFQREGTGLYRKGYRGSQAAQLWRWNQKGFQRLSGEDEEFGTGSPLWRPDGKGYYFVSEKDGNFDLYQRNFKGGKERQLTDFKDDAVMLPSIARNGSVIVFRYLFDFYRLDPRAEQPKAERIPLWHLGERNGQDKLANLEFGRVDNVSFSADGLEIAFVAGGDLWVMDTILREPRQVTSTTAEELEPVFSKDGESLLYLIDDGKSSRLCRATRTDPQRYWWQNDSFEREVLSGKGQVISDINYSPDGKHISMIRGRGDLWITDADGKNGKRLIESWSAPRYHWSPDSKWLAYSVYDNDFNSDVWVLPIDGSREPFNISRHPDNEGGVRWSPNGKLLAFTGRRFDQEIDIFYVWLREEDDRELKRERSLEKAVETLKKVRPPTKKKPAPPKKNDEAKKPAGPSKEGAFNQFMRGLFDLPPAAEEKPKAADKAEPAKPEEKKTSSKPKKGEVVIDFDGISERIRRIPIPDVSERGLFWSPDSKKLGFSAKIKGVSGLYTVEFPDKLTTPATLLAKEASVANWIVRDSKLLLVMGGVPAGFAKGKTESYSFKARQTRNRAGHWRVAFRQAWRAMRDNFYDEALNNRDWNAIGKKYERAAAGAADRFSFSRVLSMMLGELNGSHLGFRVSGGGTVAPGWKAQTGHLGLIFTPADKEEGLKVARVISGSPADREGVAIKVGDRLLEINGGKVTQRFDLARALTGLPGREVKLKVASGDKTRDVSMMPYGYANARSGLAKDLIDETSAAVEELSEGRFGYIHVARMMWNEFQKFEAEIYARGAGKDALIIDVRNNGGGFTADHLLTVLNPPRHAYTVPRGGGAGYPGDRRVYAAWTKPIIVLCNQNSFSNAEIFSHAVKTLGRGQVVGVPTAGGVISTGSKRIMDVGSIRMPFRGWFLLDGQDMELNGAVPDHILWPLPGEIPAGKDRQLEKAVEILLEDVEAFKAKPQPKRIKASER